MGRGAAPPEPRGEGARPGPTTGVGDVHAMALALSRERASSAALRQRIVEMERSRSWRLIAALRTFLSAFRGRKETPVAEAERLAAPPSIPPELRNPCPPGAASDDMSRTVDAMPWLASMVVSHAFEAVTGAQSAIDDGCQVADSPVLRIGFSGDANLAAELSCDPTIRLLDGLGPKGGAGVALPLFVLVVPERRKAGVRPVDESMFQLADHCRDAAVKSVLWLRSHEGSLPDVPMEHVERYASCFDLVCVSDPEVSRLAVVQGIGNVRYLDDAIQPFLHHPIVSSSLRSLAGRMEGVVVDALADFLETRSALAEDNVYATESSITVVDSYWDIPASKLSQARGAAGLSLVGSIFEHEKIVLTKVAGAEFFPVSQTRPAWWSRLQKLRATSMGVRVVQAEAEVGLDGVLVAPRGLETPGAIQEQATRHRQSHDVMGNASWRARISSILSEIGAEGEVWPSVPVSCLLVSKRPEIVSSALRRLKAQTYSHREIIVLMHGAEIPSSLFKEVDSSDDVQLMSAPASLCLGECINLAFQRSSGKFWFKFDDDDYYGPRYLEDMMRYASVLDHEIMGKPMAFHHFASDDALYCDPAQYRLASTLHTAGWEDGVVCGATLGGRREVLESIAFPVGRRHGADSAFLEACRREGLKLLAGDPFNFVACRGVDSGQHTWVGNEAEVRSRGILLGGRSVIDALVCA